MSRRDEIQVESGHQETTLRDFLNVVFRRKWVIVSIVALVTVLVVYFNAARPMMYKSSSRILVRRGEQSSALSGDVRYLGWSEEVSSQIEVILSDPVFKRAREIFADSVRSQGLPSTWQFDPASVRADVVGESNAFAIDYANLNPGVCQVGCEAMLQAFQEYYKLRKAPPELSDFFASEIADVNSELEHWRQKRTDFLNKEKFFDTQDESKIILNRIDRLEQQMLSLNQDVNSQDVRVRNLRQLSQLSGNDLEKQLAFAGNNILFQSGILQNIKFSLQRLEGHLEELLQKYTDKHPDVVATREQIAQLREDLRRQVQNAYRVESTMLEEKKARRTEVVTELNEARGELATIPDKDRQLTDINAAIARLEKKQEDLLRRQSDAEVALASRPAWEVTILSHASPPYTTRTRDYVRLALGPGLALIVALGVAFFLESLDHSLKNMAEVEEFLETPVLATISEFKS